MILDLVSVKKMSELRKNENLRFISFLKQQNSFRIDRIVHQLNEYYSAKIDCMACGNCCVCLRPILSEHDIDMLIRTLSIPREKFSKQYTEIDEEGDTMFSHIPCKFLDGKTCSVYTSRPEDCRSYPHLHKKLFTSRLYGIFENYSICPIVFNVIEELKARLAFR